MNETENMGELRAEETLEQTDKKCPTCGGTLDFDPKTGELACAYCGTIVDIEDEAKESAKELDFDEAENTENRDWGAEKRTVICKNCGAETVYDAETVSGECPYCGSNQVMEAGGENIMAPGGVCPFTVTKESASQSFLGWLKNKLFCPSAAKKAAKAGKMHGIYLPYWTFDAQTHTFYTARYGKERVVRRGKETHVRIDWYHTRGSYDKFINDELVCATKNHDTAMLRGIEPFDTESNLEYKPEYVAGFASERYSVGLRDAWKEAKSDINREIDSDVHQKVRTEHHTSHVDSVRLSVSYRNITYKYLLLPVWLSTYTYKGKVYRFMVNGRTGRVSGKYPVSPLRVAIAVVLGIAAVALLAWLFMGGDSSGAEIYIRSAESSLYIAM